MSRLLTRIKLPYYSQIRCQETSTKIQNPLESAVPTSTTTPPFPAKPEVVDKPPTIQIKIPKQESIKLKDLEPIAVDGSLKVVQSFDEVPGPKSLRNIASVIRLVPSISKVVTASTVQYILSTGSQIIGGADSRIVKRLLDEYGPIVRLEVPLGGNIVLLSRPEHVQKIFENEGPYPIRSNLDCIEKYRLQYRKYTQAGPFIMTGPEWVKLRNKLELPLQNMLEIHSSNIEKSCDRLIERIRRIRNQQEETPKEFFSEIYKWSMDCLMLVSFNKDFGLLDVNGLRPTSEAAVLLNSLFSATDAIRKCEGGLKLWKFFNTNEWKALVQNLDTIDSIFSKYIGSIQIAYKDKQVTDVANFNRGISLVESLILKEDMRLEDILTVLVDLMIIGVNTTSHAMSFLMYHLSRYSKVQKKLYNEIKDVNLDNKPETYEKLSYLQACIKESLRLKPPIPVLSRVLQDDLVVHNYRVPKDTFVLMATNLASLRDEYFEDPNKFDPTRWLNEAVDSEIHALATIPFGYGPKACLARKLAILQLSMLVTKIVKNFHIQYHYGDITAGTKILSFPSRPLKFRLIERNA